MGAASCGLKVRNVIGPHVCGSAVIIFGTGIETEKDEQHQGNPEHFHGIAFRLIYPIKIFINAKNVSGFHYR